MTRRIRRTPGSIQDRDGNGNTVGKLAEAADIKVKRFIIRKDMFFPSRPWTCDVEWTDGLFWTSWSYNYRTKFGIRRHINAVRERAEDDGLVYQRRVYRPLVGAPYETLVPVTPTSR